MDNKNVFIAVALSMSVLLFWSAFVDPPKSNKNQTEIVENQKPNNKELNNGLVPNINESKIEQKISREESIKKTNRILLENNKIKGSISLDGAIIDDLSFKNYREDLRSIKNLTFLNPKETDEGYFIESGWASIGDKIKVPTNKSVWNIVDNKVQSNKNPIILEWNNGSNIIFRKKITLDDNYLFKIVQEVDNKSSEKIELYPYAQITRNNKPKTIEPSSKINNEVKVFVAAKEVKTIDTYAVNEKIDKLDLIIDWGWFYFFTKPLFFIANYFFELTGNFGISIIIITVIIRLIFFPLANYSFKSMAKMKALQPEMTRLKDLHKEDRVKFQQAIMALYKKEQINPA